MLQTKLCLFLPMAEAEQGQGFHVGNVSEIAFVNTLWMYLQGYCGKHGPGWREAAKMRLV